MTAELLLLLLGAVLILVGMLAGRIPLRAIGRTLRIVAAAGGVLCVVAGLILIGSDGSSVPAGAVRVVITDELGPDQVREEVRVFLDGRDVGVIKVNEQSPRARLAVTVPKAGRHDYKTQSKIQIKGEALKMANNRGEVIIDGKSPLKIFYDAQGRTYLKPPR